MGIWEVSALRWVSLGHPCREPSRPQPGSLPRVFGGVPQGELGVPGGYQGG